MKSLTYFHRYTLCLLILFITIGCGADNETMSEPAISNDIVIIEKDGVLVTVQHYNQGPILQLLEVDAIFEIYVTNSTTEPKTVHVTIVYDSEKSDTIKLTIRSVPLSIHDTWEEAPAEVTFNVSVEVASP